ncbi:DUF4387 domain-containing protein [Jiangella asiatica]|uniref:DUF4387 domain-containing protein n=1 Tax=Jiangella asiatica TaxID=2530372 RepID=A0A4R5D731_9ACTN|nr:DUF4387 domain-containing protein [Jiangella asiatica]
MKLYELAALVRSKNAGPFALTIDVMFAGRAEYVRVRDSGVLDAGGVAALYGVPVEAVRVFHYEPALAIKVSMPRTVPSGSRLDGDVYGGQFHAPLVMLDVPPLPAAS